jgi:putative DNA primase/helicase
MTMTNVTFTTAPFKPKTAHVNDVFNALTSVCALDSSINAPAWLDGDRDRLPAAEFMAVGNGLLHLPTAKLHKPTPLFFDHSASEVMFDPDAPEPEHFMRFLDQIFERDDQAEKDSEAIETLQEWFGYTLSTDTRQQKMLLIIGPKRSGKGTIARVITALLGSASVVSPTLASLSSEFGMAPLIGKPLAIVSDARLSGKADQSIVVERLLSISGEDDVTINRKFLAHWDGRLPTRFMILTNEVPSFTDASGALPSRFIILALQNTFFGKEDHGLTDRLLGELPGILNWALVGYNRLRQRGHFHQPSSGQEVVDALDSLASPVKAFVNECYQIKAGGDSEIGKVFETWKAWCEVNGRNHSGTKQTFGKNFQAAFPAIKVKQTTDKNGKRIRVYEGLAEQENIDGLTAAEGLGWKDKLLM